MLDFVKYKFSAHGISLRNFIFEMNMLKVSTKLRLEENNIIKGHMCCPFQ